jgi:hypothetical protein
VLSNDTSALIDVTDSPKLIGSELRILAAVDLFDGKIVRWVDDWTADRSTPASTPRPAAPNNAAPIWPTGRDSRMKTRRPDAAGRCRR